MNEPHLNSPPPGPTDDPANMSEMLQELRIVGQGAQVLTAFLVILPFSARFSTIVEAEKWVYVATFLCSLVSLVLFTAPAAHHRLQRPLRDRVAFKNYASRMMVIGLVPLTMALALMTQLVTSEVIGELGATILASVVALGVIWLWWVLPYVARRRRPPAATPGPSA